MQWCGTAEENKEALFDKLTDSVNNCVLCPKMESRIGVLSELNGNINSNVLFVAEAPGRLGADRTRIPLFGDQTGINFQRLIDNIGWTRDQFFITNAVLCNPRDNTGNNTTPCKEHIINCSIYLKILIAIINPEYVVTLGLKAIDAINTIERIKINLKEHVRSSLSWNGRTLIPLYHMGPRALIHRNFYNQLADFYWLQRTVKVNVKPWERLRRSNLYKALSSDRFNPSKIQKLIVEILTKLGPISEFKLTKIIYLIDYYYLKERGRLLTDSFYLRAYDGPLPMGLDKQIDILRDQGIVATYKKKYRLIKFFSTDFSKDDLLLIDIVIEKYADKKEREIKTATYLTSPMRRILKKENYESENMAWKPIFTEDDFKYYTIQKNNGHSSEEEGDNK